MKRFQGRINEFTGKLVAGRMPEADNEVILPTGDKEDYYFSDDMIQDILDKDYKVYVGESKELTVKVVGVAYKTYNQNCLYVWWRPVT